MLSLFGTLNLASSALQAQMAGVQVAGENLANANTTGYSRQVVDLQESPYILTANGSQGTGVSVAGIQQITDALLNSQIQTQAGVVGYWNAQQSALQSAQTGLNEFLSSTSSTSSSSSTSTTSTGLAGQLSAFFNAFQAVATSPTSIADRQALVGQAQSLATLFNQISSQLSGLQTQINSSLSSQVASANQLLSNVAGLNAQIVQAQASGGNANGLLDQREQDLEQLAQYGNFQMTTQSDGSVTISAVAGSQTLVSGSNVVNSLVLEDPNNTGQLQVWTSNSNDQLTGVSYGLSSGSLEGAIDARDGSLATLQNSINNLASDLITQVNSLHSAGYSLSGSTGAAFFTGTTAADMSVNQSLVDDPSLIQASGSATATGDNTVALQLAQLGSTAQSALNNQTFSDSYNQTVAALGTALQNANNQVTNQTSVATMLSTQRSSVSGVNLDEEMTNLMTFQRAYEASAEMVTTVNQMMQDVLNMKAS